MVLGALPSLLAMAAALWLVSLLDTKRSDFFSNKFLEWLLQGQAPTSYKWSDFTPIKGLIHG